ncbi:Mur ligase family protein [Candidatus Dependentiae bacterium]
MLNVQKEKSRDTLKKGERARSYNEVVTLLNVLPKMEYEANSAKRVLQLDMLCRNPSKRVKTILVGGTNGKSTTVQLTSKLLQEEKLKVGSMISSNTLSYNEQICLNSEQIGNKQFADFTGTVLDVAQKNKINATSFEILIVASLLFFEKENVDLAIFEVGLGGRLDASAALKPEVLAITRVTADDTGLTGNDLDETAFEMLGVGKSGSHVICAEQSKIRLQKMKAKAEDLGLKWNMPVRKLAQLPYIYEQLCGRSASLSERTAQIYVEDVQGKFSPFLRGNLLATKKGQRGRPTLQAKREAERNPMKTLKQFWTEEFQLPRGRFEILDKEKPTVLLDNADNFDAISNLFLGIRLLHYKRPLEGIAVILGLKKDVDVAETLRLARYLLKKINGKLFFIPLPNQEECLNQTQIAQAAREMNIRAHGFGSLAEAFNAAKNSVDQKHGIVAISGSESLISEYWKNVREIKKL